MGRLVEVTRFVGPEPWERVQIDLLESGVWQTFHAAMDVEVEKPDMARVAEVRAMSRP